MWEEVPEMTGKVRRGSDMADIHDVRKVSHFISKVGIQFRKLTHDLVSRMPIYKPAVAHRILSSCVLLLVVSDQDRDLNRESNKKND